MTTAAAPWISVLEGGLPVRLRVPGLHVRGALIAELCGAVFAFVEAIPDGALAEVSASLAAALARRHPEQARALRRASARDPGLTPLLAALRHLLLDGLARGEDLEQALGSALADLPAAAARAQASLDGWRAAQKAAAGLATWLGYLPPKGGLRAGMAPNAIPCWNAWLTWTHGRRSPEATDRASEGQGGRPHHFALLLLAMSGRQRSLYWSPLLAERLGLRCCEPQSLGEILQTLLQRGVLFAADEDEDTRGLPLAHLLAAWGRLGGGEGLSFGAALDRLARDARSVSSAFAGGWIPPAARFEVRDDALRPLAPSELAASRGDLAWVGEILMSRSGRRANPRLDQARLPPRPDWRLSAALAHALHEGADNFAARIMPSIKGWKGWWQEIEPWLRGRAETLLADGQDSRDLPFATWRLRAADNSEPWSACRLYLEFSRAAVEEEPERLLRPEQFRCDEPALLPIVGELLLLLRAATRTSDAWLSAAKRREQGLRWPGEPVSLVWGEEGSPVPPGRRDASALPPGDRVTRAEADLSAVPCAACDALWRRILEDPRADPAQEEALYAALEGARHLLHARTHAGFPTGACPSCAGQLLPHLPAADGTLARELWEDALAPLLRGASGPAQARVVAEEAARVHLTRFEASISAWHARTHAAAPLASTRPARVAPMTATLQVRGDCAELVCALNGAQRIARTLLSGGRSPLAWTLLTRGAALLDPDSDDALTRLLGSTLGELVLSESVGRLLAELRASARALGTRLDLHVVVEAPFAALPWELLRDPEPQGTFLALDPDIAILRAQARPSARAPHPTDDPRRVLFVTAGLPEEVVRREMEVVRQSDPTLRWVDRADRRALREALSDGPYAVLHLACHGEPGRLYLTEGTPLGARELADLVSGRVSCACVVNTCLGGRAQRADLPGQDWSGVGTALLDAGLPHVVAQGATLEHADALAIAATWHRCFAVDGDPVAATLAARRALRDRLTRGPAFGLLQHFTTAGRPS